MTGQPGVIYLLHFTRPYQHARHYCGWTEDLIERLCCHASGRGARLMAVIYQAGISFTLVRTCEGTRRTERAIKNAGGAVRYCPLCTPHPRNGHWGLPPADLTPRYYPNRAPEGPQHYILLPHLAGRRN
jgi:predicted GIY-YIG superfamily endonuclease